MSKASSVTYCLETVKRNYFKIYTKYYENKTIPLRFTFKKDDPFMVHSWQKMTHLWFTHDKGDLLFLRPNPCISRRWQRAETSTPWLGWGQPPSTPPPPPPPPPIGHSETIQSLGRLWESVKVGESLLPVSSYNTKQYNTIKYNTIQYNTKQYNTIQNNTKQ